MMMMMMMMVRMCQKGKEEGRVGWGVP